MLGFRCFLVVGYLHTLDGGSRANKSLQVQNVTPKEFQIFAQGVWLVMKASECIGFGSGTAGKVITISPPCPTLPTMVQFSGDSIRCYNWAQTMM